MKQFLLSNNAVEMIAAIRENLDKEKAFLCDTFSDVVFQAVNGTDKDASWRTLTALQEYTHLINCLTMSDGELMTAEGEGGEP